jgi:hypothetical protein
MLLATELYGIYAPAILTAPGAGPSLTEDAVRRRHNAGSGEGGIRTLEAG